MHLLSVLSLKNRALIALVTVVVAIFGALSFTNLKQELIPSLEIPQLAVLTSHPGASAEVVAQDVSAVVEQALQTVPGLIGTSSTSSTGMSVVMAEFDFGTDTAKVEAKMNQALGRVGSYLPEDVDPTVLAISLDSFPVVQLAASGEDPTTLADTLADVAVPVLEKLDGVASVSVIGAPGQRVEITPDVDALTGLGLSPAQIAPLLAQNGILRSAGILEDGGRSLSVQVGDRLTSVEDVAALPLVTELGSVPLRDVATVRLTNDPTTSYSLVNGVESLSLSVTKTPDANTVDVSRAVQDALPGLEAQLAGVSFEVLVDQAPFIEESISSLATEGALGLLMAVVVILLFLRSGRATLVTAVSIPTSVLIAFVGMTAAGYSLNILTLGGLTIAIGRIVDDSIVVIENVERHMADGRPRTETIVTSVREVAGAITASTVTTVVVFLPVALVGGMAGVLFKPFAFTVAIAMLASLLVSLTIVPVLAYWFLGRRADAAETTATAEQMNHSATAEHEAGALQRGYGRLIRWVVAHRWSTVAGALVVLLGTVGLTPLLKTNFLGDTGQNTLGITQAVAPGTSLEAQLRTAREVDDVLRSLDGVDLVNTTLGASDAAAILGDGTEQISYSVVLDPDADAAEVDTSIRDALADLVPADELTVSPFAGMGMSNDVQVEITGADAAALREAADAVATDLRALPEARQVTTSLTESRPTLQITVDRAAAAEQGLTEAAVSSIVTGAMTPQAIGAITLDQTSTTVYLAPVGGPRAVSTVGEILVPAPSGSIIPLSDVATVTVVDGPVAIATADGRRVVTVDVTPASDDLGTAGVAVSAALEDVELPDGVVAEVGGITAQQGETFSQLGLAMLVAILIVYVVMVATFRSLVQPLLLLVSVPFAATGAILLQVATGVPLGVASLIGVLMLIGIVVTNAIVLVDLVKQYRDQGASVTDALITGSIRRVRPIVMTALATIFALAPMALGLTGHGGFISQPLALVVIGGLFSSTVMTLVVLPAVYHLVESRGSAPIGGDHQPGDDAQVGDGAVGADRGTGTSSSKVEGASTD